jgi:2'-5' RNA ligase
MKKKIFIAINLPEGIKKKLEFSQERISRSFNDFCPIKWTRTDNLHITLFFIGYVNIEELVDIFNKVETVAEKFSPFSVKMEKIAYGPKGKSPKMVWVEGKESSEMTKMNKELEKIILGISGESKQFIPHITLGRIIQWQFRKIEPDENPDISEDVSISFVIDSLDIMESVKGGYDILKSIKL